jgi:CheY-like chemotaxis protein
MSRSSTVFLLVEDEPSDAEFLQYAFAAAGRKDRMQVVANGEEAVRYLSGTGEHGDRTRYPVPDVIITDLKMPHMNGLEFLRWLQASESWRSVPKVVLTSSTAHSDVTAAHALGAAAYLVKPVDIHELRAMAKALSDFWRHAVIPPRPSGP